MDKSQHCVRVNIDQEKIRSCTEKIDRIEPVFVRLAQILDLAGNENRLKIIYLLQEEDDLCVCDLSDILAIMIPAVSQHLRKLKDAQLIESSKVGQTVLYALRAESVDLLRALLAQLNPLSTQLTR